MLVGSSMLVNIGRRKINLVIASNVTAGYNIFTAAGSPTDSVDVILTINTGIDVAVNLSYNTGLALNTESSWKTGSTIKIINNGTILGKGGIGGMGSGGLGGPGTNGQEAISLGWDITLDNTNGYIYGGGGGGGAGSLVGVSQGGGGGAGYGQRSDYAADYGGRLLGGYGGTNAGYGGNTATAGDNGTGKNGVPILGGAPGNAIKLNGHTVNWLGGNSSPHVEGAVS